MSPITAYPLTWPLGWERAKCRVSRDFKGSTFARGRDRLATELDRLAAREPILSTNVPLRLDGQPRGDFDLARTVDPGVAVYFTYRGVSMAMARDEYATVTANITSLAIAIEHLRGLERHGGAKMMERAFVGFAALPDPKGKPSAWMILGLDPRTDAVDPARTPDRAERERTIAEAYRAKARILHPDVGGTHDQMTELNQARDEALRLADCTPTASEPRA